MFVRLSPSMTICSPFSGVYDEGCARRARGGENMQKQAAVASYPELLRVQITPAFGRSVRELVSLLPKPIPWRRFARIPGVERQASGLRAIVDRWEAFVPNRRNLFLRASSVQRERLQRLENHGMRDEALLFRFLCLGELVPRASIDRLIGPANLDRFVDRGVLLKRDSQILLPVSLVPYDDAYHIAESRHVLTDRSTYDITPAFVGEGTDDLVRFLRRLVKRKRIGSMLDMGCGIGIATLAMQGLIPSREGAEIYERNLAFACANQALREDRNVRFYKSDLFSEVTGTFDLIVFNPWTPTRIYLDLVSKFLSQAPRFLKEGGEIVLFVSTASDRSEDPTLNTIDKILVEQSLVGTRYIGRSFFGHDNSRRISLFSASFLVIRAQGNSCHPGQRLRTGLSAEALGFATRWVLRGILERAFGYAASAS
jgi:SAM-dependent methyltransferase